jgi:HemY protein
MIRLLFAMLVLALAMLFGPVLANHPGYVMLVLGGITVEATVVGMLLCLSVVGLSLWLIWWLAKRLFHLPTLSFSFLRSRKERRARQALQQGMMAYARHDWQTAHQAFQIARAEPEWEQLKQVMAAYSAQHAGQPMLANQTAAALDPDEPASWYVVADLLLLQNNAVAAVAHLMPKAAEIGKDGKLGRLWLQALQSAGQWQTLLEQVPVAIKQQWFSKADWQNYRFTLYPAAVQGLTEKGLFDEQAAYWQALPARERKSLAVLLGKAGALAVQGLSEQAEKLLLDNLSLQDLPLAWPAIRRIPLGRSVLALRKQTQHWLRDHANHGHLYALLAYCAQQEGESEQANSAWQKAQQFLPALKAETLSG